MKAKLNKWYTMKTRFRIVKAHIRKDEGSDLAHQFRLVIEFPREYRVGYFPFELQLKDGGKGRGLTNYWCNPFGEAEIRAVIDAVQTIVINQKQLTKLQIVKARHDDWQMRRRMENWPA